MNSSFGNDSRILKKLGPALVAIHPETADAFNIRDGDQVRLSNELGELDLTAKLSDAITPGALLSYKSRWLKTEPAPHNVNVLQAPTKTDMGESSSVHGTEVTIARIP
jgi:anaerobic selenocysteine-containing dehydrogenase